MTRLVWVKVGLSEGARLQSFAVKHDVVINTAEWTTHSYVWTLSTSGQEKALNSFACECDMLERGLTEAVNAG